MDNPVSLTAFYTCGIRMADAESPAPVVADRYASQLMSPEGLRVFDRFRRLRYPNAGNLTRHRIIDDLLRDTLAAAPDTHVVLIGAGFDSRAFRIPGGNWTELDEPAIIEHKEARLPASGCPNRLVRVPVRFAFERLESKLASLAIAEPVVVVMEGVLLYLPPAQIREVAAVLREVFPRHRLICDLVTPRFVKRYSKRLHRVIQTLGASFSYFSDEPEEFVTGLGYRLLHKVSVIEQATRVGSMRIPRFLLRTALKSLRDGYSVCVFEPQTKIGARGG